MVLTTSCMRKTAESVRYRQRSANHSRPRARRGTSRNADAKVIPAMPCNTK